MLQVISKLFYFSLVHKKNWQGCASGVPIVLCKRPPISYVYFASVSVRLFFYVFNLNHFTSDNTSPNTNPKTLTTLNLTLNGRKDANIISHSKFTLKVVG